MENIQILRSLKDQLPPILDIIGYGSGMYQQLGYTDNDKPEKDVIITVDNFNEWLEANLKKNPEHYSLDKNGKPIFKRTRNKSYYDKIGCLKFSYNQDQIKMMIIEQDALKKDLDTWRYFGMAGRLTKPVILDEATPEIVKRIEKNRQDILTAIFLLKRQDTFTPIELYQAIASISYFGDFRMIGPFEKKSKPQDIVGGAYVDFEKIYGQSEMFTREGETIINPHPIDRTSTLPTGLRNALMPATMFNDMHLNDASLAVASKTVRNYFYTTNLRNTPFFALSSARTLGITKAASHASEKHQKCLSKSILT